MQSLSACAIYFSLCWTELPLVIYNTQSASCAKIWTFLIASSSAGPAAWYVYMAPSAYSPIDFFHATYFPLAHYTTLKPTCSPKNHNESVEWMSTDIQASNISGYAMHSWLCLDVYKAMMGWRAIDMNYTSRRGEISAIVTLTLSLR